MIAATEPRGGSAAADTGMQMESLRHNLQAAAEQLSVLGLPVPPLEGKLLRPLVALALVPPEHRDELPGEFWCGALALQMVHEASLLHDDILDNAAKRRGRSTLVADAGMPAALVTGDHYLTAAYRAAAQVGAPGFLERFIVAVERTVAGEIQQGRARGRRLSPKAYRGIIAGKSGELFGAAAVLGGTILGLDESDARAALGCDLGALYQQVDDLLDYCSAVDTGKPPLQDYRQGKWTWMLDLAGLEDFSGTEDEVVDAIFRSHDGGPCAAERAVSGMLDEKDRLVRLAQELSPGDTLIAQIIDSWVGTARRAVEAQTRKTAVGS